MNLWLRHSVQFNSFLFYLGHLTDSVKVDLSTYCDNAPTKETCVPRGVPKQVLIGVLIQVTVDDPPWSAIPYPYGSYRSYPGPLPSMLGCWLGRAESAIKRSFIGGAFHACQEMPRIDSSTAHDDMKAEPTTYYSLDWLWLSVTSILILWQRGHSQI